MNLTCQLHIAGVLQLLLALAHFPFSRYFRWGDELARVSLLTRQVFWVHAGFIMLVLAGMGTLSLAGADALLAPTPLARAVLGWISLFWGARLLCQFFVYSPELWRGRRFETAMHVLFSLLWAYLSCVYLAAFLHPRFHSG